MDSEAWVQLALDALSCSQKELATRLDVSPTQISKWKKGEHMSFDMDKKFRELVDIGDREPSFVVWTGSLEATTKWEKLIDYLARIANDNEETGYDTDPLTDNLRLLCWKTFDVLRQMGVDMPKTFPRELDMDYEEEDPDSFFAAVNANPYSSLISKVYDSFTNVYGFYMAYVFNFIYGDDNLDLDEVGSDIDACLLDLAAAKIDIGELADFAPKFEAFKSDVTDDYKKWLNVVKEKAFRAGAPLRAELLDMVYGSYDEIGHEAERESLGINSSRLHPDIYMDELLRGMRVIHQVLPAILEKLGIGNFELDESDLRAK
ncbi:helix-turn-helix domain-containing protein [Paraburkholderia sp. MM5482-R1]|uniref:helix-turn-helix domain-containing protein n=1 Tax=unclassified Paraburkholderia TaxID=2615204 RepID=UPI003D24941B